MISSFIRENLPKFCEERAAQIDPLLELLSALPTDSYEDHLTPLLDLLAFLYDKHCVAINYTASKEEIDFWSEIGFMVNKLIDEAR